MKRSILAITVISAFAASAFTLSMLWKADDKASTINFELLGSDKKGTFGNLSSTINFDKKDLAGSKIAASIDVKTLKAGNEKLEAHLLSPDFFDAEKFPKITFTSTEIKSTDAGYVAKGTLNMKDSTKVIEIPFTFTESDKSKAVFSGTMSVNACDYGVIKPGKAGNVNIYLSVPVTK
jgi:polyisoprenoid-binding protein YceI